MAAVHMEGESFCQSRASIFIHFLGNSSFHEKKNLQLLGSNHDLVLLCLLHPIQLQMHSGLILIEFTGVSSGGGFGFAINVRIGGCLGKLNLQAFGCFLHDFKWF